MTKAAYRVRNCTFGAITAYAIALSMPALAQDAQADQGASANSEIVVTAQFRGQKLQDTPIAITAITASQMEARGQTSVVQLAEQAPNVTLKPAGAAGGPSLIGFIRGIGQGDASPALEPGVGLYVDDVYYSTLTGSTLDLVDLERVEILRGPQGTIAGKNSIGGAIRLISKKPGTEQGGYVEASVGSYNELRMRGAADFALVPDQLFARVSVIARKQDGYVDRLDYACTHPGSGLPQITSGTDCKLGTEGGTRSIGGRLALRWQPSSTFEANFSADVTDEDSEPPANVLLAVAPSALSVGIDTDNNILTGEVGSFFGFFPYLSGYDVSWNAPGAAGACRYIAYGSGSCDPSSPNNPYVNYATYQDPRAAGTGGLGASGYTPLTAKPEQTLRSFGLSAQLEWKMSDDLAIKSISAYRHYSSGFSDDADGTPLPGDLLVQHHSHRQFSQELRLTGRAGSLLDYTLGGFYFDQKTVTTARVDLPAAGLDFISGPDQVPARTWALFAHGEVHLTSQLDLTVGLRYTDDKKMYIFGRTNPDGSPICTNGYNCALLGLDGERHTYNNSHVDYRAALSYRWTDTFMTYAQVSTGIKGGGVNPQPYYPQQILSFGPEKLTAYEVGFKSQFLDRAIRLNGSAFYNRYNNIQLNLLECSAYAGAGFGFPCLLRANAGNANIKGFELETYLQPTDRLTLDGSLSYLDFKYRDTNPLSGIPLTAVTPFTSKWKVSAGIQYKFQLGGVGSLTPRIDYSYQSSVFTNSANTPLSRIAGYGLLNGNLTFASEGNWQVAVEVRNITNKLYYLTISDFSTIGNGYASGQPAQPRTFRINFRKNF
ncbi:MAG: TonB-dependent receptor [Sphingorhabdus sp.]